MDEIYNVTPDSLARFAGLLSEPGNDTLLKGQLGMIQRKPRDEQNKIHYQFSATFLPVLVQRFKDTPEVLSGLTTILNVITYTPYFVRFSRSPAGQGLAGIQAKRMAGSIPQIQTMDVDQVGELGQFLSTLMVLQGIQDISDEDKSLLLPHIKTWQSKFPGRLAAETSERCLALLSGDGNQEYMMRRMKEMLERSMTGCANRGCNRDKSTDGSPLLQCSRCKTSVYCSSEHQKKDWVAGHKQLCFAMHVELRNSVSLRIFDRVNSKDGSGLLLTGALALPPTMATPESLEKIFEQVEEESERRAQLQEYLRPEQEDNTLRVKTRRRGSISISRFGQLSDSATSEPGSGASSPLPGVSMLASQSAFYQSRIKNGSNHSLASRVSAHSGDEGHEEDAHHVTQIQQIAGRQSISKAVGGLLPRRLSRSQSANVISSGDGNMRIGISIQQATVENQHPAVASVQATAASPRSRASQQDLATSFSSKANWMAKAKGFTQKFRRKSKPVLSGSPP
ncbi:hypothetical protein C8J56DRAFT_1046860 [Mycena floridula]|nr:hypothetical protein C8J56DRAFT_1046860 [Mycena floridula]